MGWNEFIRLLIVKTTTRLNAALSKQAVDQFSERVLVIRCPYFSLRFNPFAHSLPSSQGSPEHAQPHCSLVIQLGITNSITCRHFIRLDSSKMRSIPCLMSLAVTNDWLHTHVLRINCKEKKETNSLKRFFYISVSACAFKSRLLLYTDKIVRMYFFW